MMLATSRFRSAALCKPKPSYCVLKSITNRPTLSLTPCTTLTGTPSGSLRVTTLGQSSQTLETYTEIAEAEGASQPTSPLLNVLCVRGISWSLTASEVLGALQAAGTSARHIEVSAFLTEGQKRKASRSVSQDHRGYALLVFDDAAMAASAVRALLATAIGGPPGLKIQCAPAGLVPKNWGKSVSQTAEARQETAKHDVYLDRHRAHVKRYRERKREERITSLEEILQSLPAPGGMEALSCFEDLQAKIQGTPAVALTVGDRSQLHSAAQSLPSESQAIDWALMPSACKLGSHLLSQPQEAQGQIELNNSNLEGDRDQGMMGRRVLRKRRQVESFLLLLNQILSVRNGTCLNHSIVEFGCGSGSLLLPLAFLLPGCHFHGVDIKDSAIVLLLARAKEAGLTNVSAEVGRIEDYGGPGMDVALALHACGSASDLAMLQAFRYRAAYIVSPCCVGKIKFSVQAGLTNMTAQPLISAHGLRLPATAADAQMATAAAGDAGAVAATEAAGHNQRLASASVVDAAQTEQPSMVLTHPRSRWMRDALPASSDDSLAAFLAISRAADISHSALHSHPHLAKLAKTNIELDRSMAATEVGYHAALLQLLEPELHSCKAEVLVGVPSEMVRSVDLTKQDSEHNPLFAWPWGSRLGVI